MMTASAVGIKMMINKKALMEREVAPAQHRKEE